MALSVYGSSSTAFWRCQFQLMVTQGHFSLTLSLGSHAVVKHQDSPLLCVIRCCFHWDVMTGKSVQWCKVTLTQGSIHTHFHWTHDQQPHSNSDMACASLTLKHQFLLSLIIFGEKMFSKEHAQHISEMHNKKEEPKICLNPFINI